jgi:hypothetical protein
MSHLLNNVRPLNREDTIFSEGGKSIAIDSKINYRTTTVLDVWKDKGERR